MLVSSISLLGVPHDAHSTFLRGTAQAPPLIRKAFWNPSTNTCSELGVELGTAGLIDDLGDMAFSPDEDAWPAITGRVNQALATGQPLICLGGDHAITHPIVEGLASRYDRLSILHFDAHPDLYDEMEGDRRSHACPFARIMEAQLAQRLVQVGIRGMNTHQREQAQKHNVEVHDMKDWERPFTLKFDSPLYISFDMDALDPAFAPGVSHHEPGGLSTREAIAMIHRIEAPAIVGADIVEYNPTRDLNGVTAMAAGKLFKEIAGKMLQS